MDSDLEVENRRNYQKLMVAIEASSTRLNLLLAVCDDPSLREQLIQDYERELRGQDFLTYRVRVRSQEPSLRYALEQLVNTQPDLSTGVPAIVTVLGIDELLPVKLDAPRSEQDRFFGYLQWTREALRSFEFPIVVWLTNTVLVRLAERAPDFWSWRGGVVWFEGKPQTDYSHFARSEVRSSEPPDPSSLQPEELLAMIEQIERQQGTDAPLLATLYESLGRTYERRYGDSENRRRAIGFYEKAIALQTKLGLESDLAESFFRLGNLLSELKDDVTKALECYQTALELYRKFEDQSGEANTLQAVGDVLQFLKRSSEALENYQQAMELYRDVGDRLGEANTLQAVGDVLQFLDRRSEALENYQQAMGLYRDVGARLGEASTLNSYGDFYFSQAEYDRALSYYQQALDLAQQIGDRYSQARFLLFKARTLAKLDQKWEATQTYQAAADLFADVGLNDLVESCKTEMREVNQAIAPVPIRAPAIGSAAPTQDDWYDRSLPTSRPKRKPRRRDRGFWHWCRQLWQKLQVWWQRLR
ncbi:tetratricopeptide repeat protein [Phormidesmis sp. 146-35]